MCASLRTTTMWMHIPAKGADYYIIENNPWLSAHIMLLDFSGNTLCCHHHHSSGRVYMDKHTADLVAASISPSICYTSSKDMKQGPQFHHEDFDVPSRLNTERRFGIFLEFRCWFSVPSPINRSHLCLASDAKTDNLTIFYNEVHQTKEMFYYIAHAANSCMSSSSSLATFSERKNKREIIINWVFELPDKSVKVSQFTRKIAVVIRKFQLLLPINWVV